MLYCMSNTLCTFIAINIAMQSTKFLTFRAADKGGRATGVIFPCKGPQVGALATLSRDRNTLIEQSP